MTLYRLTMQIEVDEELLAEHDGDTKPPPNDVADWYGGDVSTALDLGIVAVVHDEVDLERVTEEDGSE